MREKDLATQAKARSIGAVYEIRPSDDETFFAGRRTDILVNGQTIGSSTTCFFFFYFFFCCCSFASFEFDLVVTGVCGVVHPETLQRFAIPNPCAALELNLEVLLALHLAQ